MSLSHKNRCMKVCFPPMPPLRQHMHTHTQMKQLLQSQLFFFTQTAQYETKRGPGGLHWFHMGDLKPHMSLLGQNSKHVCFLLAVALREICSMGATAPKAIADRSVVLRKGSCVPTPVDSGVGTDVKLSLSIPLYIPSSSVNPSLRKQEDNLHFLPFVWI